MSISFQIQQHILQFLVSRGFYVSRTTEASRLKQFVKQLAPRNSSKPLIRLGGAGDGGYLVPDDFDGIGACFSPGVSAIANFELAMAEKDIPSYMADYSVDGPPLKHPSFDFEKKFLGVTNDDIYITLGDWIARKAQNPFDLILQMDIEGAEYAVLLDVPEEVLRRFRILVIEFHGLNRLAANAGFELIEAVFIRLAKHFDIVHIHPNNCSTVLKYGEVEIPSVMEFTFLRKDRNEAVGHAAEFPHVLDEKNMSDRPDVVLPGCWRG
jgi:hypothetical protein